MEFTRCTVEISEKIATLTLNHPEVMNAVSMEMLDGLSDAMDYIEDPANGVRAMILTGTGRGFCTGANLQGRADSSKAPDAGSALETHYHPFLRRLRNLPFPLITAVNGPAAGVGMSFALMGDMVLCAQSSYFLQAFRRIGLVPDGGSTWLLPRLVGKARAMELALLGEKLPAETALEWGLVNRVFADDQLMAEANTIAKSLADGPYSLGLIRQLFLESTDNTYEEQLNMERQLQRDAGRSDDFKEGVKAFLGKRPAEFKGK
ncbi:MAG: enoyl-CoA hydratase/isomerase [Parvibaculaceae bacterium]|nr:enoyl-CoA hydratase/isomerase [Parvibaculaceae bacterium]